MESITTTESTTDETSTDSVTPQVETTTNDTSVNTSEETTEATTETKQPSIEELQAQVRRIESALKKANNEAKTFRLENNDLKKFKEQVEAEKLTEQEKRELAQKALEQQLADAKKLADDAVREKQELRVKHSVQLQAAKQGIDPGVAEKLLDWAAIEYEDDGTPSNIQSLLTALIKEYPYLVNRQNGRATPASSGGATNPPRSTTAHAVPDKLSWEYIDNLLANGGKDYNALPVSEQKRISTWMGLNTRSRR